jgi:hypothetical protein
VYRTHLKLCPAREELLAAEGLCGGGTRRTLSAMSRSTDLELRSTTFAVDALNRRSGIPRGPVLPPKR